MSKKDLYWSDEKMFLTKKRKEPALSESPETDQIEAGIYKLLTIKQQQKVPQILFCFSKFKTNSRYGSSNMDGM